AWKHIERRACADACSTRLSWTLPYQIILCSLPLLPEGEVEGLEQRPGLIIRLGSRTNDDVRAQVLIDLVVVDLWKHDVLLDAHGVVATAVEALGVQAAEVANARKRDVDQAIQKFVHALVAQRHLGADRHAFAHLEGGDRL